MNKIQTVKEITAILAVLGMTYKDFLLSIHEDDGITYIHTEVNGKANQATVYKVIGEIMNLMPICTVDTLVNEAEPNSVTHILETRNITVTILVECLGL